MDFEQVAEPIELPDNSGRCRVILRPRSNRAGSFMADVTVTSETLEGTTGAELTLAGIPLSHDQLMRLDQLLATWLADQTPFEVELAHEHWASFAFTVGPDPDYISSYEKPAFRINVVWCGIEAMVAFIVDQSCMRLLHEGVAGWLRLGRSATR